MDRSKQEITLPVDGASNIELYRFGPAGMPITEATALHNATYVL